jgi:hypothetical protein
MASTDYPANLYEEFPLLKSVAKSQSPLLYCSDLHSSLPPILRAISFSSDNTTDALQLTCQVFGCNQSWHLCMHCDYSSMRNPSRYSRIKSITDHYQSFHIPPINDVQASHDTSRHNESLLNDDNTDQSPNKRRKTRSHNEAIESDKKAVSFASNVSGWLQQAFQNGNQALAHYLGHEMGVLGLGKRSAVSQYLRLDSANKVSDEDAGLTLGCFEMFGRQTRGERVVTARVLQNITTRHEKEIKSLDAELAASKDRVENLESTL